MDLKEKGKGRVERQSSGMRKEHRAACPLSRMPLALALARSQMVTPEFLSYVARRSSLILAGFHSDTNGLWSGIFVVVVNGGFLGRFQCQMWKSVETTMMIQAMKNIKHIQTQARGLRLFFVQFEACPKVVRFQLGSEILLDFGMFPFRHQWSVE
ncbi:hypothetical protein V6N13_102046 [Hibiscus sabdariffa]|uniref:Uncharacterized protein n=1 Tax=Hibiscus sabdariffa TaxID=183260 RepID=A0ABR2D2V2_9ROSI